MRVHCVQSVRNSDKRARCRVADMLSSSFTSANHSLSLSPAVFRSSFEFMDFKVYIDSRGNVRRFLLILSAADGNCSLSNEIAHR